MKRQKNQLRIIAGIWRGRKIAFADLKQLRPTADRVRETVFNWLQNDIQGAICLDLFAGSGALGLEALSRGAEDVYFIDTNPRVIDAIKMALSTLECRKGHIHSMPAKKYLQTTPPTSFDLIFLDPPFHEEILVDLCQRLNHPSWLKHNGLVYIEREKTLSCPFPKNWRCVKEKTYGQVTFGLWQVDYESTQ